VAKKNRPVKIKYKVTLNHSGEIHVFYKVATTDRQAVNFSTFSLEEKLGLRKHSLKGNFDGRQNNFEVEIVD